jgi:hypothetical protein
MIDLEINNQDSPGVSLKILNSSKIISWFAQDFLTSEKFNEVETKFISPKKKIYDR